MAPRQRRYLKEDLMAAFLLASGMLLGVLALQ